jgi:hypothetical protein
MALATEERSGVAPLDPDLVVADIAAAAREAEVVLVSLPWGLLDSPRVHPRQRFLARGFLQAGAHAVLGHHPHVPQGIEVVDGTLVAYSLDTLVFPHSHAAWTDNVLLRLTCAAGRIARAEVIHVAGRGPPAHPAAALDRAGDADGDRGGGRGDSGVRDVSRASCSSTYAPTPGHRSLHGTACSSCPASRSSRSSRPVPAPSITPMGRPAGEVCRGREMAGWPVTL